MKKNSKKKSCDVCSVAKDITEKCWVFFLLLVLWGISEPGKIFFSLAVKFALHKTSHVAAQPCSAHTREGEEGSQTSGEGGKEK